MIDSLEEFLLAYDGNAPTKISFDIGTGEYFIDAVEDSIDLEMDPRLTRRLVRLGILYVFGGVLEINPMAIRVLQKMRAEGKSLSEAGFRSEVEASKNLYHSEQHFDEAHMEIA
jgi:hypothetical protein